MHYLYLLALYPLAALASLDGHCTGSQATDLWGESGICIHTGTCNDDHGKYKSGACPYDEDDVKCCLIGRGPSLTTNPCGGVSYCDWTANGCDGTWVSNHCPGGSNYKCCKLS